jgi:hypothetical protein
MASSVLAMLGWVVGECLTAGIAEVVVEIGKERLERAAE